MIIDTEKDCGIWVEFKDEKEGRRIYCSWKGLGTGNNSTLGDLVSGIAVIIVCYMNQSDEPWEPWYVSYFYSLIMNGVSETLRNGPIPRDSHLKLVPKESP